MIQDIVYYPDPRLRAPKLPRTAITMELRRLVASMRGTMYAHEAVGLAAPQVGVLERVFLIDAKIQPGVKGDPPPLCFINPEILGSHGVARMQEGCLSLPSVFLDIVRPGNVAMRAQDVDGNYFELEATGLLARALLHEFDHLEGKLMLDYVDVFRRDKAQRQVQRWRVDRGV